MRHFHILAAELNSNPFIDDDYDGDEANETEWSAISRLQINYYYGDKN